MCYTNQRLLYFTLLYYIYILTCMWQGKFICEKRDHAVLTGGCRKPVVRRRSSHVGTLSASWARLGGWSTSAADAHSDQHWRRHDRHAQRYHRRPEERLGQQQVERVASPWYHCWRRHDMASSSKADHVTCVACKPRPSISTQQATVCICMKLLFKTATPKWYAMQKQNDALALNVRKRSNESYAHKRNTFHMMQK